MWVILNQQLKAKVIKQKLYIKTPLQTFVLTPRYRDSQYYKNTVKNVILNQHYSISDIVHLCNNRIEITELLYGSIDSEDSFISGGE